MLALQSGRKNSRQPHIQKFSNQQKLYSQHQHQQQNIKIALYYTVNLTNSKITSNPITSFLHVLNKKG